MQAAIVLRDIARLPPVQGNILLMPIDDCSRRCGSRLRTSQLIASGSSLTSIWTCLLLEDISMITWLPGASGMILFAAAAGSVPVDMHGAWCSIAECLFQLSCDLFPVEKATSWDGCRQLNLCR